MADHITEEEQIETFKRWWNENGRSVAIGIALAVVGYFGWQGWQSQQQVAREEASLLFEDLMTAAQVEPGQQIGEEQRLKVESLADELKSDYGNSLYASSAALWMAKISVEQDDLDRAQSELQWVVEQEGDEGLGLVARFRLAQVQYANTEYDSALATLNAVDPQTHAAAYDELKGDIYLATGDLAEARSAYEQAMAAVMNTQSGRREFIQMKIDDLGVDAVAGAGVDE